MLNILYTEKKQYYDYKNGYDEEPSQLVKVELRKWQEDKCRDYILEIQVIIDGAIAIGDLKAYRSYKDSDMIRMAISKFDELFASHPNKKDLK